MVGTGLRARQERGNGDCGGNIVMGGCNGRGPDRDVELAGVSVLRKRAIGSGELWRLLRSITLKC